MTPTQDRPRVSRWYLVLFSLLYALQGVVVAYFFNFNQGYMRAAQPPVPIERIGWVQTLATIPLILKFLGGPLSDSVNLLGFGHRKPYILLGLVVQSLGLIGLTRVDPGTQLGWFTAVAVLTVVGLALYDTCCDGMVIDVTPPEDRQRVQGTLVAARFLATMICSWGFGRWLEVTGNGPGRADGVLLACALFGLAPLVLTLILPEPKRAADAEHFKWEALGALIRPRALLLLAFGALYATVSYGVEINLRSFYDERQFGEGQIGTFASLRYLGRAVGAVALPLFAFRLRRRGTLLVGIVALLVTTAGQAFVGDGVTAAVWGFLFGAANGWNDALFNVMCMEASDPRMAASTYALFMAVSNIGAAGGGIFSSSVAMVGRFEPVFLASAMVLSFALPLIRPLSRSAPSSDPEKRPHADPVV